MAAGHWTAAEDEERGAGPSVCGSGERLTASVLAFFSCFFSSRLLASSAVKLEEPWV